MFSALIKICNFLSTVYNICKLREYEKSLLDGVEEKLPFFRSNPFSFKVSNELKTKLQNAKH